MKKILASDVVVGTMLVRWNGRVSEIVAIDEGVRTLMGIGMAGETVTRVFWFDRADGSRGCVSRTPEQMVEVQN